MDNINDTTIFHNTFDNIADEVILQHSDNIWSEYDFFPSKKNLALIFITWRMILVYVLSHY